MPVSVHQSYWVPKYGSSRIYFGRSDSQLRMREGKKLLPRPRIIPEHPAQRRRDRAGVLLLHAAHHHAEVIGLDHDADPQRGEDVVDRRSDLLGESLLHLETAGE